MQFAIDRELERAQDNSEFATNRELNKTQQPKAKPKPRVIRKPTKGSYKDTGVYYHGTSGETKIEGDYSESNNNMYGGGFYTTTGKSVAQSYTKKGSRSRGTKYSPIVYRVVEMNKGKTFDMEAPDSAMFVKRLLRNEMDVEGMSLVEAMDEYRWDSGDNYITKGEVNETFEAIYTLLDNAGYTSMTHKGGRLTNSDTKHLVKIFLRPHRDIKLVTQNPYVAGQAYTR